MESIPSDLWTISFDFSIIETTFLFTTLTSVERRVLSDSEVTRKSS